MFLQILQGLIVVIIGILILVFYRPLVDFFGRIGWVERHLGPAETYTVWKIFGVLIIICGVLWAGGTMQEILIKVIRFFRQLLYF